MARRAREGKELEGFAEDLGRLLGTAQARAAKWIGERQTIAKQLQQIRDTSSQLLSELATAAGRGRRQGADIAPITRKRNLSAKARKAISDAQKRRWAAVRAAKAAVTVKKK